ncbi:Uu.00g110730.m01.CDS01 [Anthostomella pinea]|uniref:Uu.00g110730.m01.CDS01 n=1 Tax=Anthostomella pinea TaxID=933095 RepID=A0AAI8VEZ8_9PEZI|nr:Uu.00g110730.m01.CDS01 [Anthostomella pinea]
MRATSMAAQKHREERGPYQHLDTDRREIRVLDLLPSSKPDAPLKGNLRTVSLDDELEYEALSYTWGSASEEQATIIDGDHSVPVTNNLSRALRRFRRRLVKRTIWIGAICINQSDIPERGKQVAIMGDIYVSATCVEVWLGDAPDVPSTRIGTALMHLGEFGLPHRGALLRWLETMETAIRDTSPRWMDRAWVIQEFMLNPEVYLCFESQRFRYSGPRMAHMKRLIEPKLKGVGAVRRSSLPLFDELSTRLSELNLLKRYSGLILADIFLYLPVSSSRRSARP